MIIHLIIISILFILLILLYKIISNCINNIEYITNINSLLLPENRKFPYRYFKDENNNTLPIVALTAFFRSDDDEKRYYNYIKNDIQVIGITAYKTFPKKILDVSEDKYHLTNNFDYTKNIKVWLACMKNLNNYNFNDNNYTIDMSESDFYDVDYHNTTKKYDFIYICNKDSDNCPINGWNAINRNFDLALKCFPIMINNFKLKGLCVGRIGCGLENKYGDSLEITDWLDYYVLQQKMRESNFLFLPNILDASPRVATECLIKGVPILMNQNIICGYKYINYETGQFFNDENDLSISLKILLDKINNINPRKWWNENYGIEKSSIKLRNFLYKEYPNILKNVKKVSLII